MEKLQLGDAEKAASLTDAHHRRENLADLMFKERAAVHTKNMRNDRRSGRPTSLQRDLHKLGQRDSNRVLKAGSTTGPDGFDYFDEQTDYGKCGKLKRCCRRFGLCNRGRKEREARPGHALPSEKAPSVIKGVWGADGVEDERARTKNLSRKIEWTPGNLFFRRRVDAWTAVGERRGGGRGAKEWGFAPLLCCQVCCCVLLRVLHGALYSC